jgi:UDPglucose 6-dehydrogenase
MKIGFLGFGDVGRGNVDALQFLNEGLEVGVFDPAVPGSQLSDLRGAEIIYVAVTTPEAPQRGISTAIVEQAIADYFSTRNDSIRPVIVLNSTLPVGTTKALAAQYPQADFVYHPEFMAVRKHAKVALSTSQRVQMRSQAAHPSRIVLGSPGRDESAARKVGTLYQESGAKILYTDSDEAELIKLAANAFLAMKVTFANEVFDICASLGLDYEVVRAGISLDPRIGPSHLGITDERGWGGGCFPRDVPEFAKLAKAHTKYSTEVLAAVNLVNDEMRRRASGQ